MIKMCVVDKNGEVINIGKWDTNISPLPTGATEVELEVIQDADGGWHPVGKKPQQDKIDILEQENKQLWDTVEWMFKGDGYIPKKKVK